MKCWRRKRKRFPLAKRSRASERTYGEGKVITVVSLFMLRCLTFGQLSHLSVRCDGVFNFQLPQLFAWFPSKKASTRQSQRWERRTERDAEVLGNISIIILVLNHNCSPNLRLREIKYSTSEGGACVRRKGNVKKTNSKFCYPRRAKEFLF